MENRRLYPEINVCRAFLIFSVIIAHSKVNFPNDNITYTLINRAWESLGTIGVIGFFIVSGYLYYYNKDSPKKLLIKKFKTIIMPWIALGSLVFLITQIEVFNMSSKEIMKEYIKFISGNGSYLYFNTILIMLFILLYKLRRNDKILKFLIMLNGISIFLTYFFHFKVLTPFLNIFNWIGYFCIGILIAKKDKVKKLKNIDRKIIIIIFLLSLGVSTLFDQTTYFTPLNIVTQVTGVWVIFLISTYSAFNNKYMYFIAKHSFYIYLLHMPIVSLVKKIITHININLFCLIPIIVLIINCLFIKIIIEITNKIKEKNK